MAKQPNVLSAMLRWFSVWFRRALQLLLIVLGKVPEHVAFVMDGNRRYAERQHVDKATGHTHGYGKMVDVIHWCMELGVKHITVYAFSIDNFKRAPEEVASLMRLAEEKYIELAQVNGLAEREGIRMRIVGDLELPPPGVQGAAARLMRGTASLGRQRATLNVCFSYTSSEETVAAVHELQSAVRGAQLLPADVRPETLHAALRTGPHSPPVDLLIRTSGETRLSDFLLWQASHAHLCYLPVMWPDMSYLDFARCVLSYQRHASALAGLRRRAAERLAGTSVASTAAAKAVVEEQEDAQQPIGSAEHLLGRRANREAEWDRKQVSEPHTGHAARGKSGAVAEARESATAGSPVAGSSESTAAWWWWGQRGGVRHRHAGGSRGREHAGGRPLAPCDTEASCSDGNRCKAALRQPGGAGGLLGLYRSLVAWMGADVGLGLWSTAAGLPRAVSSIWALQAGRLWRWGGRGAVGRGADGARGRLWRLWRWGVKGAGLEEDAGYGGVGGEGGGDMGRELRLLRFFERQEAARAAWIEAHAGL